MARHRARLAYQNRHFAGRVEHEEIQASFPWPLFDIFNSEFFLRQNQPYFTREGTYGLVEQRGHSLKLRRFGEAEQAKPAC